MNEGSGLAAGAVHGQRVADCGLHNKAIENRAVVAVVVKPINHALVPLGLLSLRTQTIPWALLLHDRCGVRIRCLPGRGDF